MFRIPTTNAVLSLLRSRLLLPRLPLLSALRSPRPRTSAAGRAHGMHALTGEAAAFSRFMYNQCSNVIHLRLQLIERVLEDEQPGLAVLSGDMVSGFAFPAGDLAGRLGRLVGSSGSSQLTASWYEQQWHRLVEPLHAAGVPYASILGNHDGEADLGRRDVAELAHAVGGALSLTRPGPPGLPGGGNYWIDVLEPQGQAAVARIWMLDSGNRGCGRLAWGWWAGPGQGCRAACGVPLPAIMACGSPTCRGRWG